MDKFRAVYPVSNRAVLNGDGEDQADYIEAEIRQERFDQDKKWGPQNHDPFKWLAIIGEEVGEINKAALEAFNFKSGKWDEQKLAHYRLELVQVAAVAKAMIECIDRDTWNCSLSMGYKTSSQRFAEDRMGFDFGAPEGDKSVEYSHVSIDKDHGHDKN